MTGQVEGLELPRDISLTWVLGLILLCCTACSNLQETAREETIDTTPPAEFTAAADDLEAPRILAETPLQQTRADDNLQTIVDRGTGNYIGAADADNQGQVAATDGDITLNFQDTDLREFIKVILGDVLGENYLIDPGIGGTVTIQTSNPIGREQLLPIFEEILAMNNAAIVRSEGIYKILPREQAVRGNLAPAARGTEARQGYGVSIIPLRYVAALEMQKILDPFLSDSTSLTIDSKRNLLLLSGTQQEQELIRDTIDIFDVDWMRGMSMGMYPLNYVDPKTLKDELDTILHAVEGEPSGELLDGLIRTVPVERLNAILIISSTPAALREVETWLRRLDKPGEHVGKRLYVYNMQNAKAVDLADILSTVFSGAADTRTRRAAELAPGLKPVEIGTPQSETGGQQSRPTIPGEGMFLPSDDTIQIIADDVRNALVVLATPDDYKMVETAIRKLDVVPLQVLIEASILEVTLRDDLSYGVEWFFKNRLDINQGKTGVATLDLGNTGISAQVPAFSYVIQDATGVNFALNALANESDVNVLSSPSLMVLDNQTATINVGDEIPVPSRQSISNLDPSSPTVNEIQYRKTGVTLTVTPRVNSGGLVTMEIVQEVSSAVNTTTSDIDAPTIQNRLIESVVAINTGETIVLGGLIQDNETRSESGIPGLYKIPLLGKLFGRTNNEMSRTELLILITPRVVGSRSDARAITNEFRKRLRSIVPLELKRTTEAN
jgi:general secretion pathway protein D